MTVTIAAPFVDVRGETLRWALGLPELPALAVRELTAEDGRQVQLRVLGASHQVVVRRGAQVVVTETVACDLPASAALPGEVDRGGYRFHSAVERHEPAAFAAAVTALVDQLADDPAAIVAEFPGLPHAVTALAARTSGRLGWQTWHCYPQTGELVSTSTLLDTGEGADVEQI